MEFGKIEVMVQGGLADVQLPKMVAVSQKFNDEAIADIQNETEKEIANKIELNGLKDKRIAITAGSRGIKKIDEILLSLIKVLQNAGAVPFIVPAMGSHGGATGSGQKNFYKTIILPKNRWELISSHQWKRYK